MRSQLTPFGIACRKFRLERAKVMADQAAAFACSVAFISAVERGHSSAPTDYVEKFASWLQLSKMDEIELAQLAAGERKIIRFVPKDAQCAQLASKLANFLNDAPPDALERLDSALSMEKGSGKR